MKKLLVFFFGASMLTASTVVASDELQKNVASKKDTEKSIANRTLGAASTGALGISGGQITQSLSEKKSDENAELEMRAYLSTFICEYGDNKFKGGETKISLPAQEDLTSLRAEYKALATSLKNVKTELGLKPGIESEEISDSADSGLYDNAATGVTSGVYASVSRALQDSGGVDAVAWEKQKSETGERLSNATTLAVAATALSVATNVVINKVGVDKLLSASDGSLTQDSNGNLNLLSANTRNQKITAITGYEGAVESVRALEKTVYDRLGEFGTVIDLELPKGEPASEIGMKLKKAKDGNYSSIADVISVPLGHMKNRSVELETAEKNLKSKSDAQTKAEAKLNSIKEEFNKEKTKQENAQLAKRKADELAQADQDDEDASEAVAEAVTALDTANTALEAAQTNLDDANTELEKAKTGVAKAQNEIIEIAKEMQNNAQAVLNGIDKGTALTRQIDEDNLKVEQGKFEKRINASVAEIQKLTKSIESESGDLSNITLVKVPGYDNAESRAQAAEEQMYRELSAFGASIDVELKSSASGNEIIAALRGDYRELANKMIEPLNDLKINSEKLTSAVATAETAKTEFNKAYTEFETSLATHDSNLEYANSAVYKAKESITSMTGLQAAIIQKTEESVAHVEGAVKNLQTSNAKVGPAKNKLLKKRDDLYNEQLKLVDLADKVSMDAETIYQMIREQRGKINDEDEKSESNED